MKIKYPTLRCANCNKFFKRKDFREYPLVFCSRKCREIYWGKHPETHPGWKGGSCKHRDGYILKYILGHNHPNLIHDKYILEHRLIMEEKLGRYLTKDEIVHHINGIKDDNRIENLALISRKEHNTNTLISLLQEKIRELEIRLKQTREGAYGL